MYNGKKKHTILLTGGTGFIGKNIISLLGKKYDIFAPNRYELNIIDQSSVSKYLSNKKFDIVIHCAILTPGRNENDDKKNMLDYTIRGLLNLQVYENKFKKIIYVGSGAEFDKTRDIIEVKETDIGEVIPKDAYGYAKYILNQIAINSKNIYNLRLFGCYGKFEQDKQLIKSITASILKNNTINMNQDCYFSYILVDDFISVIEWVMHNTTKYHEYNVCNPKKYKLTDLVKIIKLHLESNAKINIAKDGLNKEYTGDCSRLLREIPNFQFTPIEIGIKQEIEWIRSILV